MADAATGLIVLFFVFTVTIVGITGQKPHRGVPIPVFILHAILGVIIILLFVLAHSEQSFDTCVLRHKLNAAAAQTSQDEAKIRQKCQNDGVK